MSTLIHVTGLVVGLIASVAIPVALIIGVTKLLMWCQDEPLPEPAATPWVDAVVRGEMARKPAEVPARSGQDGTR